MPKKTVAFRDAVLGEFYCHNARDGYIYYHAAHNWPDTVVELTYVHSTREEDENSLRLLRELCGHPAYWNARMLAYGIRYLTQESSTGQQVVQGHGAARVSADQFTLIGIDIEEWRVIRASQAAGYAEGDFKFTYRSDLLGGHTGLIIDGTLADGPIGATIDLYGKPFGAC